MTSVKMTLGEGLGAAALLLLLAPGLVGCASNQALRASLNERDADIAELSAENARLTEELARARNERDGLHSALAEASARLAKQSAAIPAQSGSAQPQTRLQYDDLKAAGIGAARRGDSIVFTVPSAVTFASGHADLTDKGRKALRALAARLKDDFPADSIIHVEGHTDSDPIRRSGFKTNRDLSWARARAVHEFLVQECRIPDKRFVVVGHGPHRPVVANDTPEHKAQNRRVEILVRAPE